MRKDCFSRLVTYLGIWIMQGFAVDEEGGPNVVLPQSVEDELSALIWAIIKGKEEGGWLGLGLGLELGQGLGCVTIYGLGPVTLVRLWKDTKYDFSDGALFHNIECCHSLADKQHSAILVLYTKLPVSSFLG